MSNDPIARRMFDPFRQEVVVVDADHPMNSISTDAYLHSAILEFFKYDHLPQHLQSVSKPIGDLAQQMDVLLSNGAEKQAGLRKLLEAKDCFVRAALSRK